MIDTALLQGLASLETQDGRKSIKGPNGEDSYNLFNIKDFSGKGGFRALDKAEGSRDAYRTYGSREESIQDLVGLLERKYPKAFQALNTGDAQGFAMGLKEGGYATDPKYVEKLTGTIASVRNKRPSAQAEQAVTSSAAAGGTAVDQLVGLREAGYDDIIIDALGKGYKPDEIVKYIAQSAQETGNAAHDKRAAKGFLPNAAEGLVDTGQRLLRGAKQIVATGEDTERLQAEEAADRANPDNIALRSTAGAKVGAVAPLVGAAFVPGVNGVLGGVLAGAAAGALEPTVEGESRLQNAALGGATGAAGIGAGKLTGGVLNKTVQAAQKGLRGGRSADEVLGTIKALEDQGIKVSARDVSPLLNRAANDAERTWGAGIGQADTALTREQQLARALTRRMGQEADTLDSSYIASAQKRIGSQFDDALDGVGVDGKNLLTKLDEVSAAQKTGLPSLQSSLPTKIADELKQRFAAGPVSAVELQGIRSQIGRELSSSSLEGSARQGLSDLNSAITKSLEEALPAEKLAKWKTSNQEWRNLQAAENLVRGSNDSGEITARKLAAAIKQGKLRNSYERGDAPFQDLQKALGTLEDSKAGLVASGLDRGTLNALGAFASGGVSIPAAGLTANMALRVLNSTNPKIRSLLLGLTPVKQVELKRLALAAALGTQQHQ